MVNPDVAFEFTPYSLHFKEPGGTSRGILRDKPTYFLKGTLRNDPTVVAYGEVPYFPGLSNEPQAALEEALGILTASGDYPAVLERYNFSSLRFGIEQVINSLSGVNGLIFPSSFTEGISHIPINGLVWMGDSKKMKQRVMEKLESGFDCIKIKIAAIDWEEELNLIRFIRDIAGYDVSIRVDANGGFSPEDCLLRLEQLSRYDIHSIEQPVMPGNFSLMRKICEESPIPVALDEELIGVAPGDSRSELLSYIKPAYIILKTALCYGFSGASDWIRRAGDSGVGFWITSALESSVGLNAIAQFTGGLHPQLPQGLGTGMLFTNNFSSPLVLEGSFLRYDPQATSYNSELEKLRWIA